MLHHWFIKNNSQIRFSWNSTAPPHKEELFFANNINHIVHYSEVLLNEMSLFVAAAFHEMARISMKIWYDVFGIAQYLGIWVCVCSRTVFLRNSSLMMDLPKNPRSWDVDLCFVLCLWVQSVLRSRTLPDTPSHLAPFLHILHPSG